MFYSLEEVKFRGGSVDKYFSEQLVYSDIKLIDQKCSKCVFLLVDQNSNGVCLVRWNILILKIPIEKFYILFGLRTLIFQQGYHLLLVVNIDNNPKISLLYPKRVNSNFVLKINRIPPNAYLR